MSHAADFERLQQLPEFDQVMKDATGNMKPVVITTVDGDPDENPRHEKVIKLGIHHFLENELDCYCKAPNAPGRCALNMVEKHMAPLSRELAGLILPHDNYGSHLDNDCKTIDESWEAANLAFPG